MFEYLVLMWGYCLVGCGSFRKWILARGNESPEAGFWAFITQDHFLLRLCSPYSEQLASCPYYHAFPAFYCDFLTVMACIPSNCEPKSTSLPQVFCHSMKEESMHRHREGTEHACVDTRKEQSMLRAHFRGADNHSGYCKARTTKCCENQGLGGCTWLALDQRNQAGLELGPSSSADTR